MIHAEGVDIGAGSDQTFLPKLHQSMWDYAYGHGGTNEQVRDVHISIFFDHDSLPLIVRRNTAPKQIGDMI